MSATVREFARTSVGVSFEDRGERSLSDIARRLGYDSGPFASIHPPACLQFLKQPGVSRFDLESLRERGTRHLADAS